MQKIPKTHMGKQLEHAVRQCAAFCHSKRADKFNDAIDTDWKVYSDSYKTDMVDLALDFGRFLTANYPHIRNSYDIVPREIQAFLEKKAFTCTQSTLKTKISRLWKLKKCCMRISCSKNQEKFHWNTSSVTVPESDHLFDGEKRPLHRRGVRVRLGSNCQRVSGRRERRKTARHPDL